MLEPLFVRHQNINKQYFSISHLFERRAKRGAWFGGVGTILKHIFGTLDEEDAIKYDEALNSVQNNNRKLASIVKENILISTSTINSFNHSLYKLKVNEQHLDENINRLSIKLKKMADTTNKLVFISGINSIINSIEASLINLSLKIEDIINAVLFSNLNILHPFIITPHQLYRELVDNHKHLPKGLDLAVNLDLSTIHYVLNMSNLVCYYLNNKIMFVLRVPLVTNQEFYLYHNIPLPIPHNILKPDSFSLITPANKYIAITKDKSYYSGLESLSNCKTAEPSNYICSITNVFPSNAKPCCESELLTKVITKLPVQCKTEFLSGVIDIWNPISNNRWIFVQTTPTKLSIDCINLDLTEINIYGTGILRVPKQCTAYCKNTRLYSNNNVLTSVHQCLLLLNLI